MISLAQRVRDFRYSKGWGPDELASRAEISRTALYQIESGKTGLPRAGTLRRIAVALDVSMDELLGHADSSRPGQFPGRPSSDFPAVAARPRDLGEWIPSEGGPLSVPHSPYVGHLHPAIREEVRGEEVRPAHEPIQRFRTASVPEVNVAREGELMAKFHDLLHSPLGPGISRIVDELHQMLPRSRNLA